KSNEDGPDRQAFSAQAGGACCVLTAVDLRPRDIEPQHPASYQQFLRKVDFSSQHSEKGVICLR
ncbi:hypothetical protein, partial [Candidatus Electronema sp. TJ]|uniref:hypothetical protein n=1 Tax=Candidatus Electronema sp. TJ TaxID=3401573 RepID=UPI003AA7DE73